MLLLVVVHKVSSSSSSNGRIFKIESSEVEMVDLTLENGYYPTTGYDGGGAISLTGSSTTLDMTACTVSGHTAYSTRSFGYGGAILVGFVMQCFKKMIEK